ncbi:CoF synthetase [Photobacterium leiognathi subsp. mandapamensis]|nr:CoF synthetase [Photobacterium leiognathi subsp. mandapamensis]
MIKFLYDNSPIFFQNIMCSVYGYLEKKNRFGRGFQSNLISLCESEYFSKEKIVDNQRIKLSNSLRIAKKLNIYRCLNDVSFENIENDPFSVLQKINVMTKSELINVVSDYKGKGKVVKTSGTTGKCLSVIRDGNLTSYQWAVWFRHRARFGVKLNDVSVNFTGKPLLPPNRKSRKVWRYNAAQNQYLICMQSINDDNIHGLVKFLNTINPKFYSGYPSIIFQLADTARRFGLKIEESSVPEVVFFGAENVLDYQRHEISSWLGPKPVLTDQYGLTEANCNFSRCEQGMYHEDFEFSYIELIDFEKNEDGSKTGRLIGTTLENSTFPLLRYDTGDIATFAPDGFKCSCGRESRVIFHVDGRKDDYIITSDGRKIMRLDYLFKNTHEVTEAQVIQEQLGSLIIKCVPSRLFEKSIFEKKIISSFQEYIDKNMKIDFEYVASIERSSTGKFKAVVNRL